MSSVESLPGGLTTEQFVAYRRARCAGVGAGAAYRGVTAAVGLAGFTWSSVGSGQIRAYPTGRSDLAGFTVLITAVPDPEPDTSWLGEFSDQWCPGPLVAHRPDRHGYRYFHPTYTLAQRRRDLTALGYSRAVAYETALRHAREDMGWARDPSDLLITVAVCKAGVELGTAGIGGVLLDPDQDHDEQVLGIVADHDLHAEALAQADSTFRALGAHPPAGHTPTRLPTYQEGQDTYRVTLQETQRREVAVYATTPAEAVDHALGDTVIDSTVVEGTATATVVSVARLSPRGPRQL